MQLSHKTVALENRIAQALAQPQTDWDPMILAALARRRRALYAGEAFAMLRAELGAFWRRLRFAALAPQIARFRAE